MFDAFLSYTHDDKDLADLVRRHLTENEINVFQDRHSIDYGSAIPSAIANGISQSKTFIVLLSATSVKSNWVETECQIAMSFMADLKPPTRIIPLVKDKDLERPPLLRHLNFIDFWCESSLQESLQRLTDAIRHNSYATEAAGILADESLPDVIATTKRRLVVIGQTLKRFVCERDTRAAIEIALQRGVRVILVLSNPLSQHVKSGDHYRELQGRPSLTSEIGDSLENISGFYKLIQRDRNLEVQLTNYAARFRVILIDDAVCFVNLYLYGENAPTALDMRLDAYSDTAHRSWFESIRVSTKRIMNAFDNINYIKDGVLDKCWRDRSLAQFDSWSLQRKRRFMATKYFYSMRTREFDTRFGNLIEIEVKAYLDRFERGKKILVVGCGSGKEVNYLRDLGCNVEGIDFSQPEIALAQERFLEFRQCFRIGDFYDLHLEDSEPELDGIVANAALVHLFDRDDLQSVLKNFARRLKTGGLLFLRQLYKESDGRVIEEEWSETDQEFRTPRWFVYYSRAELVETARRVGLEPISDVDEEAVQSAGATLEIVRDKGFRHSQFSGVWWSTVLLSKVARAASGRASRSKIGDLGTANAKGKLI